MSAPSAGPDAGGISRRHFLGLGAAGLGAALLMSRLAGAGETAANPDAPQSSVLVDLTRCIGCRACENACRVRQKRSPLPTGRVGYGPGEGRLSFTSWTFVDFREVHGESSAMTVFPVKRQCMHCVDAACVWPARWRRCTRLRAARWSTPHRAASVAGTA